MGHTPVPLTLDVFVNTASADRHVNVTVDHARTGGKEGGREKKEHEGTRKKFAWGLMRFNGR